MHIKMYVVKEFLKRTIKIKIDNKVAIFKRKNVIINTQSRHIN